MQCCRANFSRLVNNLNTSSVTGYNKFDEKVTQIKKQTDTKATTINALTA